MPRTLAMIHTISGLASTFQKLAEEMMPDVKVMHIADEPLLRIVLNAGGVSPSAYRRVCEDVLCAAEAGADAVLVTCSSISPCVDVAQKMVSIPVMKIDQPMADIAVATGKRIGVIATAPTALKPTSELIESRARVAGAEIQLKPVLCEGAYDALFAGDTARHDQIVRDHLARLVQEVDVVVLAQASMARVVDSMPEDERRVPILFSVHSGMERARDVINGL